MVSAVMLSLAALFAGVVSTTAVGETVLRHGTDHGGGTGTERTTGEKPVTGLSGGKGASPRAAGQFRNPVSTGADPTLVHDKGRYYVATTEGDAVRIRSSRSIGTLLTAEPKEVWKGDDPGRSKQIWAPALFKSEGHWYLYYTASDGNDATHRMYVLESRGDDPMGPYTFKGKLADKDNDRWAIDGEPFRHDGKLYFAWSGQRDDGVGNQLFVAPMSNPWTLSGRRVHLPADGNCPEVREGPTPLSHDGTLFLTYSACDTGKPDYAIWAKSLAPGADPLDPGAWKQEPGPLFSRNDAAGVYGPGHHFFFRSPDGKEDWIAYHAKNTAVNTYSWRTTRVQRIGWTPQGKPDLGRPAALGQALDLPSGDPGPGTHSLNDSDAAYSGTWQSGGGCGTQCYRGDDHWSGERDAKATFRFTGTRLALLSVKDTGNGIAGISVDGGPEKKVDFYGKPRVGGQFQWASPQLKAGEHTVTVRVTGEKNPDSASTVIGIDRADVQP